MNKNYVTKKGHQQMLSTLNHMIDVELREAIEMIKDAKDKGDVSENAEYESAKAYHENLSIKISNLEMKVRNSEIIVPIKNGKVNMLSNIQIKNQNDQILDWTLVPENEIDIKNGKISFNSPVGVALLGRNLGEKVDIKIPAGQIQLEILRID